MCELSLSRGVHREFIRKSETQRQIKGRTQERQNRPEIESPKEACVSKQDPERENPHEPPFFIFASTFE